MVDVFTRQFLIGESAITPSDLMDERLVSRSIVVRAEEPNRISQYGVDRVSDYFMCLLQIKERTSSHAILSSEILRNECRSSGECEACNSLTYPLPPTVRGELRAHWLERLKQHR